MESHLENHASDALDAMFKHPYSGLSTHVGCPQKAYYQFYSNGDDYDSDSDPYASFELESPNDSPQIAPRLRVKHDNNYKYRPACWRTNDSDSTAPVFLESLFSYTCRDYDPNGNGEKWTREAAAFYRLLVHPFLNHRVQPYRSIETDVFPMALPQREPLRFSLVESAIRQVNAKWTATFWPLSTFGAAHALEQSELPQRFPTIFPRFSNDGFSSLLRTTGDSQPPCIQYSTYEVPLDAAADLEIDAEVPQDEEYNHRPKRIKAATAQPRNTFPLRAPTLRAGIVGLAGALVRLKDVALPTTSKLGFIVTLFGGVLHLSYPPQRDELKLYSHVVYLHQLCGTDISGVLETLKQTLTALQGPQHPSSDPSTIDQAALLAIDHMFASTWIDCNQNVTLLSLLEPFLSRPEDHIRIGQLIGSTVTLNWPLFVRFCAYRNDSVIEMLRKSQEGRGHKLKSTLEKQFRKRYPLKRLPRGSDARSTGLYKWPPTPKDPKDFNSSLSSFLSFVSTCPPSSGNDIPRAPIYIHADLVYLRWPYLRRVLDSGLTESKTLVIELPLSYDAVEAILHTIYTGKPTEMSSAVVLELLENGAEFGLLDPSRLDSHAPDIKMSDSAVGRYHDTHLPYLSPLVHALVARMFDGEGFDLLTAFNLGIKLELPRWSTWRIKSISDWSATDMTSYPPELQRLIETVRVLVHPKTEDLDDFEEDY